MKKIVIISILLTLFVSFGFAAQQAQTIHISGDALLPAKCPAGAKAYLTVKIIWKDLSIQDGGTGRTIIEEAIFEAKEGENKVEFSGIRITPEVSRGEISITAKCEIRAEQQIIETLIIDKDSKENPVPMSFDQAVKFSAQRIKLMLKEQ